MAFLGTMVSVEVKTMDGKYFEWFREIVLNFYFILFYFNIFFPIV